MCYIVTVDDWLKNFENKVKPFVELQDKLDIAKAGKMGKKDSEAYPLVRPRDNQANSVHFLLYFLYTGSKPML